MKVNISKSTYVFLLISFLAGYFEYMYLLLLIIFVHESGHYFFAKIVGFNSCKIVIYPFGGLTQYNEDLNTSTNKELFVLLGGIIFQLLFYYLTLVLCNNLYVTYHVFNIIKRINILLISFNFLPVLPLDGGKLLNIILDKLLPYKVSNIVTIVISIIFSLVFLFNKITIFRILLFIFLLKNIIYEIKNVDYKYYSFLLERYLYNYKFNKIKIIKSKNLFRRDYNHIINNTFEESYLHNLFDSKEYLC